MDGIIKIEMNRNEIHFDSFPFEMKKTRRNEQESNSFPLKLLCTNNLITFEMNTFIFLYIVYVYII